MANFPLDSSKARQKVPLARCINMNMISCFQPTILARAPDSSGFCRFQAFPGLTLERRNGIKKTPEQNPVYSTLSICAHHGTSEHAGLCVTSMMRLLLPFDKTSTCFKIICFLNAHNMSQASHPPLCWSPCERTHISRSNSLSSFFAPRLLKDQPEVRSFWTAHFLPFF